MNLSLSNDIASASSPVTVSEPIAPDRVLPYKQVGDVELRLNVFLPEKDGNSKHPVIVWFHGGGWSGGQPDQFYPQSAYLVKRGLVCISVEYRVKNVHGTTPFDAIRDAFDAMRFVRAHAAEWGGDPDRIAAGGGSAGAHLAAAAATLTAEDLAGTPDQAKVARPKLLLLLNPVFDNGPEGGYGYDRLGDRWQEGSPAHNLHAGVPPTLVMLGDQDNLVPVETAERFSKKLDALGVPNRLVIYPGADHGFFNKNKHDGIYLPKTLAEVDRFLVEQGWLTKGEE
jgi:acetyl esterase/lipase